LIAKPTSLGIPSKREILAVAILDAIKGEIGHAKNVAKSQY
jgi:hypothetical protein